MLAGDLLAWPRPGPRLPAVHPTWGQRHRVARGTDEVQVHIGGGLNSYYAGAFARYRKIKGDGTLDTGDFNFSLPEYTLGLNVGKRWIWNSGFTMNFALGYGYAFDDLEVSNSSQAAVDAIDVFRDEYAFMSGFLGEFSIGYAF